MFKTRLLTNIQHRAMGKRKTIIIVCRAHDQNLEPIATEKIKKVLQTNLNLDTPLLAKHSVAFQRGSVPICAYDRNLAS